MTPEEAGLIEPGDGGPPANSVLLRLRRKLKAIRGSSIERRLITVAGPVVGEDEGSEELMKCVDALLTEVVLNPPGSVLGE